MTKPLIVLTTDFGTTDNFVGIMKGVILGISPEAIIIDLMHEIQPQNFKQASFLLSVSIDYFPKGSIFLSIVDPGVGTTRNAIVVLTEKYTFVAPDNGLLTYVLQKYKPIAIYSIFNKKYQLDYISATFHGRDVFAPVAAHLANGIDVKTIGDLINPISLITINPPKCFLDDQHIWHGEIMHIDRFGNLITSLKASTLGISNIEFSKQNLRWSVEIADLKIKYLSQTFADVDLGQFLAYIGSYGYIEIGVRDGNASQKSGFTIEESVYVYKF
jgi:S-adenosylmethionine hydrolase